MAGPEAPSSTDAVIIPPRGYLGAEVRTGQTIRVTDVEGQQVGDLVAFAKNNLREKFWISNTIRLNGTIYVTTGHTLYSELSRPMLHIRAGSGERHDLLAGSCNAEIDKVRYGVDDHQGCVENFVKALAPWGITRDEVPMSLNLWMNCPVRSDGTWSIEEPQSSAGSFVELEAAMDLVVALSNCPQDLNPCNSGTLKPLRWEIIDS